MIRAVQLIYDCNVSMAPQHHPLPFSTCKSFCCNPIFNYRQNAAFSHAHCSSMRYLCKVSFMRCSVVKTISSLLINCRKPTCDDRAQTVRQSGCLFATWSILYAFFVFSFFPCTTPVRALLLIPDVSNCSCARAESPSYPPILLSTSHWRLPVFIIYQLSSSNHCLSIIVCQLSWENNKIKIRKQNSVVMCWLEIEETESTTY